MFTGIIREIGKVKGVRRKGSVKELDIYCPKTLESSGLGDSVAVNGVCLTVSRKGDLLSFDVVSNTTRKTNLKRLKAGDFVNLENALKMGQDISGHIVSGHIDGERKIRKNLKNSSGQVLEISKIEDDRGLVVPRGSVAIDGISLTVAEDFKDLFRIFLIPYTLKDTTLAEKRPGNYVNVEYDVMGKYASGRDMSNALTTEKLKKNGFI